MSNTQYLNDLSERGKEGKGEEGEGRKGGRGRSDEDKLQTSGAAGAKTLGQK